MTRGKRGTLFNVVILALVVMLADFPSGVGAQQVATMGAVLTNAQQVPPTATGAAGIAAVFLNVADNRINWLIVHNVVSPTMGHFHGNAFPGTNAAIVVDLPSNSGGSLVSPIVGSAQRTAGQAADLLAGRWYLNIHSGIYPGGEIRGQVAVTDDNASLLVFPSNATFARTTGFDLTLILNTPGRTPTGATVTLNGVNVTSAFLACIRPGTIAGGLLTVRCSVPGNLLSAGDNFINFVITLSDASQVGTTALWHVEANTE